MERGAMLLLSGGMRLVIASAIALGAIAPEVAAQSGSEAREVRCVINSNGLPTYSGPCLFYPETGGSFTVTPPRGRNFPGEVTGISVSIEEPGVAQVHGLTPTGPASRWGTAVRSRRDRACWEGPDFSVCAY